MRRIALLLFLAGCGKDGPDASDDADPCGWGDEPEPAVARGAYTPDKGTTTVSGTVKFKGKPPLRRKIDMGSEQYCKKCFSEPPLSQTVIVGKNGGLKNTYVTVKYGLRGWKFEKPVGEAFLNQERCLFLPRVLAVRAGQTIRIRNSDTVLHNVHAMLGSKTLFNIGQTQKGQEDTEVIKRPGVYTVKCEVHGWMQCFIAVAKHPFYAVTGEDGEYALAKLPPGEYTIEAWHEKYGTQQSKVKVEDGATLALDFTFSR